MLLFSSIITEKKKKRFSRQSMYIHDVENKMDELKKNTIVDYYLNGGY